MPAEITMPQLSDTMSEGTVVKWRKKEGDKVKAGDVIAEVETDKATMEMEAFEAGTLAHIVVKEGEKIAVGKAIAILATGKEDPAQVKQQVGSGAASQEMSQSADGASTRTAEMGTKDGPLHASRSAPADQAPTHNTATATMEIASSGEIHDLTDTLHGATREDISTEPPQRGNGADHPNRVFASPLARRIAADHGIDLSQVQGTGPSGRVIQRDVLQAVKSGTGAKAQAAPAAAPQKESPAAPAAPARMGSGEKQVIPLTKMRATIAQRLQQAKQQIPHIYLSIDIDMEAVNTLRERLNKQLEAEKVRISVADFVAKATAVALQRHPALNAHFNGQNNEIIRFGDVHLGNAVALPDGLIVPVLRNVHLMGLKEIRQRGAELFDRAKAQRLKREEMTGATFTITNLGLWGIKEFSAIVNPPEVAILAVSAAEKRPVVRNDQLVARTMMTVMLSADHRAIDGATAADFLKTLKSLLEEPGMMLV